MVEGQLPNGVAASSNGIAELTPAESSEIDGIIAAYQLSQDPALLESIVRFYDSWIKFIMTRVVNPSGTTLDSGDLYSYGVIGLIGALQRFDPQKGSFQTWAFPRIKGAAQDAVRRLSSNSRTRSVHFRPFGESEEEEVVDPRDTIELMVTRTPTLELREALSSLPGSQQLVVLLLVNGVTVPHVSALVGIPRNVVTHLRNQALATLRSRLSAELSSVREV